jgi:uncharacterized membrane protein (UPF0127 family)
MMMFAAGLTSAGTAALVGTLLAAALTSHAAAQTQRAVAFDRDTLAIETSSGAHRFNVELARTPAQQSQGLMYRRKLAPDAGMLFVYPAPYRISMWMKNTLIPLDMVFIGADGRVVDIAQRTVPLSLQPISTSEPALAVFEVNAGTASRLDIRKGDIVRHAAFASARAK